MINLSKQSVLTRCSIELNSYKLSTDYSMIISPF